MATDFSSINIENLFSSLSIKDLQKCKSILNSVIERELIKDKLKVKSVSINDYVTQCDNYIDVQGDLYQELLQDIKRTKLSDNSKSDNKVTNVWISTIDQPYSWVSQSLKLPVRHINLTHRAFLNIPPFKSNVIKSIW